MIIKYACKFQFSHLKKFEITLKKTLNLKIQNYEIKNSSKRHKSKIKLSN